MGTAYKDWTLLIDGSIGVGIRQRRLRQILLVRPTDPVNFASIRTPLSVKFQSNDMKRLVTVDAP